MSERDEVIARAALVMRAYVERDPGASAALASYLLSMYAAEQITASRLAELLGMSAGAPAFRLLVAEARRAYGGPNAPEEGAMTNLELSALVAWARTMPRSTMTAGGNGGGGDLARAVANMDAAMLAQAPAAIVALADRVKALEAALGYMAGFTPGHAPNDSAAYVNGLADATRVYKRLANDALKGEGNE